MGYFKKLNKVSTIFNHYQSFASDESIYRIGLAAIMASRQNYASLQSIVNADLKVFSQYGEDGILDFLTYKLNIPKPIFVEIGTGDYRESNTRFLYQRTNTKGMIIDCDQQLTDKVKNILGDYFWKGDLSIISRFVTLDNIMSLLKLGDFDWLGCDILSLDIDGNDFWIMKKIVKSCRCKILVLEYNSLFGCDVEVTTPYSDLFNRSSYHHSNLCWGASLRALINLLVGHGYTFVGTNLNNSNGFWVKADLLPQLGIDEPSLDSLHQYVQNYCRESRDNNGKLTYEGGDNRLKAIRDCLLVDLRRGEDLRNIGDIFGF